MKRIFRSVVVLAVVAILGMNCVIAQTKFSLHIGGSFPLGSYADCQDSPNSLQNGDYIIAWNTKTDKAGAALGLNLGAKLRFNLPAIKGLGVIVTTDLFFNPSNKEARDFFEDYMTVTWENIGIKKYGINIPKYINIPIMLGVNYEYNVKNNVKIWGEGALGLNIGVITSFKANYSYYDLEFLSEINYDNQHTFAFQLGVGTLLSEQLSIGLHYYNLGSQEVEGLSRYTATSDYGAEGDRGNFALDRINPNMLTLRFGYHF